MLVLVKLIGIYLVVMGIILLLNPKVLKACTDFWGQRKRIYVGGIISFLIGVILLLVATQGRSPGVIIVFGVLALIKGILLLILGPEKAKSFINWWSQKSALFIRLYGVLALAMGALLIYST